jgi:hypothetical protein
MPITSNVQEVIAGLRARAEKIDSLVEKTARDCGEIARTNTLPLARVDTGKWRDSIKILEVMRQAPGVWSLKFGSEGAFNEKGTNYGAIREFLDGTIATGWFISRPEFEADWERNMSELKNG